MKMLPPPSYTLLAAGAPWGSFINCKLLHLISQISNRCKNPPLVQTPPNAGVPATTCPPLAWTPPVTRFGAYEGSPGLLGNGEAQLGGGGLDMKAGRAAGPASQWGS